MAEFEVHAEREIGLLLPDGTEVWPGQEWHGHTVDTPEARRALVAAIEVSAGNLNISANALKLNYSWLARINHRYITRVQGEVDKLPIDSPTLLVAIEQNAEEPSDLVPERHE